MNRIFGTLILAAVLGFSGFAQHNEKDIVLSTAGTTDAFTVVEAPAIFLYRSELNTAATANFMITYGPNFPDSAKAAFSYAARIWSYLINSPIPIRVNAKWDTLKTGVLAETRPDSLFKNFTGSPYADTYYPVALAEFFVRGELNGADRYDIITTISKKVAWSCDTNGTPRTGKHDMVTVILHELAHGLGFNVSFDVDSATGNGSWGFLDNGQRYPTVYDKACAVGRFYQNGTRLTTSFSDPTILGNQLKGNNVFFDGGYNSYHLNNDTVPKIYAPSIWKKGSSISHLDSVTFPVGTANSLMKYSLNPAEIIHSPGEVGLSILKDIGWDVNRIITFTIPKADTVLRQTTTLTLRWTDNSGGSVIAQLMRKGINGIYIYERSISGLSLSSTGKNQYNWTLDSNLLDGEYKIKMLNEELGTGYGYSRGFRITNTPQVAAPTILPPGGSFSVTQPCSLFCATPFAVIRYTLSQQGDPDSLSPQYSSPFPITSNITVKARAFKIGYLPSTTTTAIFIVRPGTRVAQVDENNIAFGRWAWWKPFGYWEDWPETVFDAGNSSITYKANQDYIRGTLQKYNRWTRDNTTIFPNYTPISADVNTREILAHFKSANTATIRAELIEGGIGGDSVKFKDPWLIDDSSDTRGARNRGINAIWHSKPSPFQPNTNSSGVGSDYKGVFLNQAFNVSEQPYYSVGAPQQQTINGLTGYFSYWSANSADAAFKDSTKDTTGVVFKRAGAVVTAKYKANQYSTSGTATSGNNQRKIAQSSSGTFCMVYESDDRIFFSKSSNCATWSRDFPVSDGSMGTINKYPSILVSGNIVNVVWQSEYWYATKHYCHIQLRRYDIGADYWGAVELVSQDWIYSPNHVATPVIDGILDPIGSWLDRKKVAWRGTDGIRIMDYNSGAKSDVTTVVGTISASVSPSIVKFNDDAYALCWELYGGIYYAECSYFSGDWTWSNAARVSPEEWYCRKPSMGMSYAGAGGCSSYKPTIAWECWNSVIEGASIHVRQTRFGCNNWENITSFSLPWADSELDPVIGTYATNSQLSLLWSSQNDVYVARYNGACWSSISLLATGANGGEGCSINGAVPTTLAALWKKPSGAIAVTTSGVNPPLDSENCLAEDAINSPLDSRNDGTATPIPFRHNRHGMVQLSQAIGGNRKFLKGSLAFEIAKMNLVTSRGTSKIELENLSSLPNDRSELSSKPFTVTETNSRLVFAGAMYGQKLFVPPESLRTVNQPLALVTLRENRKGRTAKQVWRLPFSSLSVGTDSTYGTFREFTVDLSDLVGKELSVDVEMLGRARDLTPVIDDDYLLAPNRRIQLFGSSLAKVVEKTIPRLYALHQNYPNPFNPSTTFRFDLPEAQEISLKVFNVLGQEVMLVANGLHEAGEHSVTADFTNLPSGMYIYRMNAGKFSDVKKLVLVK